MWPKPVWGRINPLKYEQKELHRRIEVMARSLAAFDFKANICIGPRPRNNPGRHALLAPVSLGYNSRLFGKPPVHPIERSSNYVKVESYAHL